jgi:O-antigen/teichoic acid export membrane protein
MKLRERLRAWSADGFLRAVGVLVGGTGLAQAILALALPVATRLYTPADFGVLSVFAGLVNILSVAACLRFEIAIPIPRREVFARNLLALSVGCALAAAGVIGVIVAWFSAVLAQWLNQPRLAPYLWLVPVGVLLAGCMSALQFWYARRQSFVAIARARVGQALASAGAQLGCGVAGLAPLGLLIAQLLNAGMGCLTLGYRVLREETALRRSVSLRRMRAMFRQYDRFPKFSTLEAVSNAAQGYLPLIMIAALVSVPEAGYLGLAMYAVQAPMALLGSAVSQVYLSRAAHEHREQRLGAFTTEVFGRLLRLGVGPIVFAGVVAPDAFAFVFGQDWRRAGDLVVWMTPWFVLQFLSYPLSMALPVTHSQKTSLVLQIGGMLVRVAAVQVAALTIPSRISESYALSGLVAYAGYLAVVLHVVAARRSDVLREIKGAAPYIVAWAAAGVLAAAVLAALIPDS